MPICSAPVNCTIPENYTVPFDADSDIDGIGVSFNTSIIHFLSVVLHCLTLVQVIAAFYVAAWVTIILLTITYFTSAPEEFNNFGFSKLDIRVVKNGQTIVQSVSWRLFRRRAQIRAGAKTAKALQKAILLLSDQQLITGVSIGIVGLARVCEITQYHFNTAMNLSLAASVAHSMTFSFIGSTSSKMSSFAPGERLRC